GDQCHPRTQGGTHGADYDARLPRHTGDWPPESPGAVRLAAAASAAADPAEVVLRSAGTPRPYRRGTAAARPGGAGCRAGPDGAGAHRIGGGVLPALLC